MLLHSDRSRRNSFSEEKLHRCSVTGVHKYGTKNQSQTNETDP